MGKGKNKYRHIEKKMLSFFRENPGKEYNYKQIAAVLNLRDTRGRNELIKFLNLNVASKQLLSPSRGKYTLAVTKKQYHRGILEVTSSGRGFVICEDLEQDISITKNGINKAFNGDFVEVYCYKQKNNGSLEGEIVDIIERKKTTFVGILQIEKNYAFVLTRGARMYTDFFIDKKQLSPDYQDGDKVLVRFDEWPKRAESPFGTLIENFGPPGETATEMHAILSDYGLPLRFPDEVEAAAAEIDQSITEEEIKKRRDFRKVLTFTIDPKTAKDFDDALSFEILGEDLYEVGIHIADVSYYVKEGTILDDEAYQRATSIYLVDRVVPMLPECLSNHACSLRPREEKYTFSAVFEINNNGQLFNQWFGRTVIFSDARFSYEEAQHIIETKTNTIPDDVSLTNKTYTTSDDIKQAILTLDKLAKLLRHNRLNSGAISFDKLEVKFNLDSNNNPSDVYFKTSKDANKLIEEFMLLANRKVSEFIGKQTPSKTFVYRVHDVPDQQKLENLQRIVYQFGHKLNLKSPKQISTSLNQLLKDVVGTKEQNLVDTLAIRSMSKAEYTTQNIGHYGLAFEFYSHFTSPIRRYPDIMAHRLLQHYLDGKSSPNQSTFEDKCKHASKMENLATKAERDSIKYMQIKYMQHHKNTSFSGVISGVTEWGIYVEITENKCEGMVRIKDLTQDYFTFDSENYALVGEKTKQCYQLGDRVTVKVKHTDLIRRHLDFTII
jgi:ribonuclease R